jgi:hypothetical protein
MEMRLQEAIGHAEDTTKRPDVKLAEAEIASLRHSKLHNIQQCADCHSYL